MKRKLNQGLKNRQDMLRQQSIDKVERAIKELQYEGYTITTKLLIERTGLARSTFSKQHIIDVLKKNKVCRFASKTTITNLQPNKDIAMIQNEFKKASKDIENLKKKLEKMINKNIILENTLKEKTQECQLLRGEIMMLYQKLSNRKI